MPKTKLLPLAKSPVRPVKTPFTVLLMVILILTDPFVKIILCNGLQISQTSV